MIAEITYKERKYKVNLSEPIDISIPLSGSKENVTAWYVDTPKIEPVMNDNFVGDINLGGDVNFRNVSFNPHGNGTHTECVGHISKEHYSINRCLKNFFFLANVVSILPKNIGGDRIITLEQIQQVWQTNDSEAIVIRTLPNANDKLSMQYSNTNPPFMDHKAITFLLENGVNHLLIDTPSIDKEKDDGKLLAHHVFWEYPANTQEQRTISELIYVPSFTPDGQYLLNLQIASFENDASPSKPVLYDILT